MTWGELKKLMKKKKVPDNAKMVKTGWQNEDDAMFGGYNTENDVDYVEYYEKLNQVDIH